MRIEPASDSAAEGTGSIISEHLWPAPRTRKLTPGLPSPIAPRTVNRVESFRFADADGRRIALRHQPGRSPTIVFLPGYASDMEGTKADAVAAWAARRAQAFVRLDYSGCGRSEGAFCDGTLSRWTADAAAAIDACTRGPIVLVGSSMGGWIALLLALARPGQVTALVGVAPAPDFTRWGLVDTLTSDERAHLARAGGFERASAYSDTPTLYTRAFIDDGSHHLLMHRAIDYRGPVRLLHGQHDPDVPWQLSLDLSARLVSADVQVALVKDGDHRLSRPTDLALLTATLEALLSRCSAD